MVKAGMDTDAPGNVCATYRASLHLLIHFGQHAGYDGNANYNVTGFSQLHDSGTGGVSLGTYTPTGIFLTHLPQSVPLSNFKLWPFANCTQFEKCPTALASRKTLRNILDNGMLDDVHSGMHRLT